MGREELRQSEGPSWAVQSEGWPAGGAPETPHPSRQAVWLQLRVEGQTGAGRRPRMEGAGLEATARSLGLAEGSGKAD